MSVCVDELHEWFDIPDGTLAIWIETSSRPSKWRVKVDRGPTVDGWHVVFTTMIFRFIRNNAPFYAEVWYETC
jgi:hypothetical protein